MRRLPFAAVILAQTVRDADSNALPLLPLLLPLAASISWCLLFVPSICDALLTSAGILIEHTVCMMHAMGGILAVSTDLSEAPSVAPAQQSSLRNIGASIAAEMNAKRQGQAPGRTDELKARIDQIDEITEGMDEIGETLELVSSLEATMSDEEVDEAPDTFYGDEHLEVTEGPEAQKTPTAEPLEAVQPEVAVAKKVSEGSTSYDSTMTQYLDDEASLASAAIPEVDSN